MPMSMNRNSNFVFWTLVALMDIIPVLSALKTALAMPNVTAVA